MMGELFLYFEVFIFDGIHYCLKPVPRSIGTRYTSLSHTLVLLSVFRHVNAMCYVT